MPNTTNYSFPTPADTDLVKNGADAIRDLGDAVDTAMNTALGTKKAGLVLLNTTSFSGVSSQSFNNVFSATYDNYEIVFNNVSGADQWISFRFRAAGSDDSTSNYMTQALGAVSTTVTGGRSSSLTNWPFVQYVTANANNNCHTFRISNPFATKGTSAFLTQSVNVTNSAAIEIAFRTLGLNTSTSYDGFTIFGSSITGSISVYGFNK
jgi:hypothetical protein